MMCSSIGWALRQFAPSGPGVVANEVRASVELRGAALLDSVAAILLLVMMGGLRAALSEAEATNRIDQTQDVLSSKYTSILAGSVLIVLLFLAAIVQAAGAKDAATYIHVFSALPMAAYLWAVSPRLPLLGGLGRAASLLGIVGGLAVLLRPLGLLFGEMLGPDGWVGWCLFAGFGVWVFVVSVALFRYAKR